MTKGEMMKALEGIPDETNMLVEVVIYETYDQSTAQAKVFDNIFMHGGVICVGAPSDAEWEERGGEDVTDDPSRT